MFACFLSLGLLKPAQVSVDVNDGAKNFIHTKFFSKKSVAAKNYDFMTKKCSANFERI